MTFWKRLKQVGPGALVAAAFIGPGTVTTCATSGASYGYTLLWAMLLSAISVIIMQEMAARVGIASGGGLGEALRKRFTSPFARFLIALIVIAAVFVGNIAYETGNLTGSLLGVKAIFPVLNTGNWTTILVAVLAVIVGILLFTGRTDLIEKILTGLVVLMGVLFLICAFASKPDWGAVAKGLFTFQTPDMERGWFYIAGLMGTTVVPYNIYLHASSAAKKWKDPKRDIKTSRLDSILSIGLGGIISMAIIVCAASVGFTEPPKNGGEMAVMLSPLLGSWATVLFGIGLFAAGATSALTAPLSAAYASSGILGWGENTKKFRFKIFWIVVLLAGIVFTLLFGSSPTEIILFAQAANAFLLPITGILLLITANSKDIMGNYKNKWLSNVLGIIVIGLFLFIAIRNFTAFTESFRKLISGV